MEGHDVGTHAAAFAEGGSVEGRRTIARVGARASKCLQTVLKCLFSPRAFDKHRFVRDDHAFADCGRRARSRHQFPESNHGIDEQWHR
jgi:hypothetical protein